MTPSRLRSHSFRCVKIDKDNQNQRLVSTISNQGKNIAGKRFGRLMVLRKAPSNKWRAPLWHCQCDCGETAIIDGRSMLDRRTKSCGCLNRELSSKRLFKHGDTMGGHSCEYTSYSKMRDRCLNPRNKSYANYGGRGISICQRWLDGFENFLADMGRRPTPKHTIDRINNEGNYEPKNCRWALRIVQNRNYRKVIPIERSDGIKYWSITEASESNNCAWITIYNACRTGHKFSGFNWKFLPRNEMKV